MENFPEWDWSNHPTQEWPTFPELEACRVGQLLHTSDLSFSVLPFSKWMCFLWVSYPCSLLQLGVGGW
jgi:hypothetical protein